MRYVGASRHVAADRISGPTSRPSAKLDSYPNSHLPPASIWTQAQQPCFSSNGIFSKFRSENDDFDYKAAAGLRQ